MLSITTGRLTEAVRSAYKSPSNGGSINQRRFSTAGPNGGSSGGKFGGGNDRPRGAGAYTYKQAFEKHSSTSKPSAGSADRRANLSDHRASSAKRFSGVKMEGKFSPLKGKDSAGKTGVNMPENRDLSRTSAGDVKRDREALSFRGGAQGQETSAKPKPLSSSVTASSMKSSITFDRSGDDAVYQGAPPKPGSPQQQSRGGQQSRFSGEGARGGRGDAAGAPQRFASGAGAGAGSAAPRVAPLKSKKGEEVDLEEEEEDIITEIATGATKSTDRIGSQSGFAGTGEAESLEEEASERLETMKRVVDKDLASEELDELGEERLIEEGADELEDEAADLEARLHREQLLETQAAFNEATLELGLVNRLAQAEEDEDYNADFDMMLRRSLNAGGRTFNMEDLLAGDSMEEVVGEEQLTTASEMMEEQEIMETPMVFGHQSEVSLHSEKGLIYGVVDIFDRILLEKQRKMLSLAKRQRRFELWKAVSWSIRQKKFAGKRKRKEERIKAARLIREKNEADPDMTYYPTLNLWISKTELRNEALRNAVSGALSNPTWSRDQRRNFILGVQKDLVIMHTPMDPEKEKIRQAVYASVPKKVPTDDSRTIENLLTLPITDWSLLMAQAERSMDARQRANRFEPSPFEQRKSKL